MTHFPDEPLAESAPLARRLAAEHCLKDAQGGDVCGWYHGLWQDLRLIGFDASPVDQAGFFQEAFAVVARKPGRKRILISGAADYGILAHLLSACRRNAVEGDVTVLDLCPTPLHLNTWFADRMGVPVTTICADILEHEPEQAFDVICSHSFLIQFAPEHRNLVVAKWRRMLASGGNIVAVNRVRPTDGPVRFTPESARDFCEVTARRLEENPAYSTPEREEILRTAEVFAACRVTYALPAEELALLLTQNGLKIELQTTIVSPDPRIPNVRGEPPRVVENACIVAATV